METTKCNNKVDCLVRTRGVAQKYTFKWILENYSRIKNGKEMESSRFYPEDGCAWWATIHKSSTDLWIYLARCGGHGDVELQLELKVEGGNDKMWTNSSSTFNYGSSNKRCTVLGSMQLKESDVKETANDIVEVTMGLKIYKMNTSQLTSSVQYSFLSEPEFQRDMWESMLDDLEKLYKRQLNTDVALSIEGQTLDVHKAILSSRSPVFAKMFQQEMAETTKSVVLIEDVKMATMDEVVAFMYGKAKRDYSFDTAMEVYYAADKYDVKRLKEVCGAILASNLSEENAGQILSLADQHRDRMLKEKVMQFITFRMKSCVKKEWWSNLMSNSSELASELEAFIADFK